MRLGELIEWLTTNPEIEVDSLTVVGCYRGAYNVLAVWPEPERITAGELADKLCREALGQTFTGYKGGNYLMGRESEVCVGQWDTTSGSGDLQGVNAMTGNWIWVSDRAHAN